MAEGGGERSEDKLLKLKKKFHYFVNEFVKSLETKIEESKKHGSVGGTKDQKEKDAEKVLQSTGVVGASIKICRMAINRRTVQNQKKQDRKTTDVLSPVSNLHKMLVEAAGMLFYTFEQQLMDITCVNGFWSAGLDKFADDAVKNIMNHIQTLEDYKNLEITTRMFVEGAFSGNTSRASIQQLIIGSPGHSIKIEGEETTTYQVLETKGVVTVNQSGKVGKQYGMSETVHFRRALDWELEGLADGRNPLEQTTNYTYVMNKDILNAELETILKQIDYKDPSFMPNLMKEIMNPIDENLEAICKGVQQLLKRGQDQSKFKDLSGFLWYFVQLKAMELEQMDEEAWKNVFDRISTKRQYQKEKGTMMGRYQVTTNDSLQKFLLEVIKLEKGDYWTHLGSIVIFQEDKITMKIVQASSSTPISNKGCTFTLIVGLEHLNFEPILTSQVTLFVSESRMSSVEEKIREIGTFSPVPIKWSEISGPVQDRVKETLKVEIQGSMYPLSHFPAGCEMLQGEMLNDLLQGKSPRIFGVEENFDKFTYVPRWIDVGEVEYVFFDDPNKLILVFNVDPYQAVGIDWFKNYYNDEVRKERNVVEYMDDRDLDILKSNIIVTEGLKSYKSVFAKMQELRSGFKRRLVKYSSDELKFKWLQPQHEFFSDEKRKQMVFIVADPGDGKTTLLRNLRSSLDLPEAVKIYMKSRELLQIEKNRKNVPLMEYIVGQFAKNDFEKSVLEEFKLLLLLDEVEEGLTNEPEALQTLLTKLTDMDKVRVVGTLRSHKETEVRHLFPNADLFKLASLDLESQARIISDRPSKSLDKDAKQVFKLEDLLLSYRLELNAAFCKILADHCTPLLQQQTGKGLSMFGENMICEMLVKENLNHYLGQIVGFKEENLNVKFPFYSIINKGYMSTHTFLAMNELYPEYAKRLNFSADTELQKLALEQGLISSLDPVKFGHQMIAKYFVNKWILDVKNKVIQVEQEDVFQEFITHVRENSSSDM